ncbi:MAG: hypothetical protein V1922_05700 [bacterium]
MNYEISRGGRIKAAGLSFALFTDPASVYIGHPNAANAAMMTNEYAMLRKSPSEAVRDRFFPRDPATSGTLKSGAGLPRTCITNHQGVGTFLTHNLREDANPNRQLRVDIERQTGYAILEAHLEEQLKKKPSNPQIVQQLKIVRKLFEQGNLPEAQLMYEQLVQMGEEQGIQVKRKADVGREGLFFIRPSVPKFPAEMDPTTHESMRQRGEQLVEQMIEVAHQKRDEFAQTHDLHVKTGKESFPPLYFQVDFLIKPDRSTQISDVELPDVGFFLASLDPKGNPTVADAQKTVTERLESTALSIYKKAFDHHSKSINFITRKAVLENLEDTLEIKEIEVLRNAVEKLGVTTKVISDEDAINMTQDELGILMNVDVESPSFQQLLMKRVEDESVPIYPDPFLLLAQDELTEHPQVSVPRESLDLLNGVFTTAERASNRERAAVQLAAINHFIRQLGMPEDCDIFHMYIPGQPTPVPFYRNDLRGLQIALNYAGNTSSVKLRGISINPDNAVLFDPSEKPMYSMFRYMFNQKV